MTIEFRELRNEDIDEVYGLIELLKEEGSEVSFTDIQSKEEIGDWIDSDVNLTYVALEGSEVIAVVKGRRGNEESKRHSVFLTASTHPRVRGNGVAAMLTNYSLERMKEKGVVIARIYVYSNNKSSLAAVRKLGFTLGGSVLMHHYDSKAGEYVDDIIFHKILSDD